MAKPEVGGTTQSNLPNTFIVYDSIGNKIILTEEMIRNGDFSGTFNGNVNTSGTSYKVYGAVAN